MLPDLDVGAKYHHERYDGRGYPQGLKGKSIPKTARIICVADAYDAMTSNRVYRKHLSKDEVLAELERCRGTQFDPEIVDAFLADLERTSDWVITENQLDKETFGDASSKLLKRIMEDNQKHSQKRTELDDLTGVYNRSAGERKVIASMQENEGFLLLINVDNMRQLNRKYGFRRGDSWLKMIVEIVREISSDIIVSRFGGDEFLCFVPNVTEDEKIREMMDDFMKEVEHCANTEGMFAEFSVSVGITVYHGGDVNLHQLLMEADKALYHVKQETKNGYYFYEQVAEWSDDVTKVDWNQVLDVLHRLGTEQDEKNTQQGLVHVYDTLTGANEKTTSDVRFVMLTAREENEKQMSVEERSEVMRMMEYAIVNTLQDEKAIAQYSSVQRIIMISSDDMNHIDQMMEKVLENFYKLYDKKDVELYYDVATSECLDDSMPH
jgi:diguanylate cyclase (GGDEF)-like protein